MSHTINHLRKLRLQRSAPARKLERLPANGRRFGRGGGEQERERKRKHTSNLARRAAAVFHVLNIRP